MKKIVFLFGVFFLALSSVFAAEGFEIRIKLSDYDTNQVAIGYHYGGKQLVKDTITASAPGEFIYKGEESLDGGVYMLVMIPSNDFVEFLIDENDQHFTIETSAKDLSGNLKFTNSKANDLFQEYSSFLRSKSKESRELRESKEKASADEQAKISTRQNELDKQVKSFQEETVKKNPGTLTAAIIKASWSVDLPEFKGSEEEVKQNRYNYYKGHYFDNLDFADPRLIRSPLLYNKVMSYIDNLVYKIPDSLNMEIDNIIQLASSNSETYHYWVTNFLNKYAKESAELVGMDAVYVHIAQKYYCDANAKTDWVDEEQRKKICKNANEFAPILIGKTAPNVRLKKPDDSWMMLHEVEADFTVVYFWDPDCGHCKKSIPKAVEFYKEYAGKGVKIVGICNRRGEERKMCWDAIEERDMKNWINVSDPYLQGKSKYNVKSNPRIFVLDRNKKILSKGIGSDQLKEVLDFHLNKLQKEKAANSK